jgi:hypothetical protein
LQQVIQDHQRETRHAAEAGVVGDKEHATRLARRGRVQGVRGPQPGRRTQAGRFPQDGLRDGQQPRLGLLKKLFVSDFAFSRINARFC